MSDAVVQPFILLSVMRPLDVPVNACHLSWADIWVDFICTCMYM